MPIYPPPKTIKLFGSSSIEKTSSEFKQFSPPLNYGIAGNDPDAIIMWSASRTTPSLVCTDLEFKKLAVPRK